MRKSGILFPIISLASKYGIGCFSKEAYDFVDFLKESGQSYWQILPLGPTGFGDSPYQPLSAFAGNPYFICLETLIQDGLLTWDECNACDFGQDVERVDYGALYNNRYSILEKAYIRFKEKKLDQDKEYKDFLEKEAFWLEDYALYKALKEKYQGASWLDWEDADRQRDEKALEQVRKDYADVIGFNYFMQFEFYEQWKALHAYAAGKGLEIIGDIPFYVAMDSADSWSHPEVFQFDKELLPKAVAGCPPDAFSKTGQLWGNPVYDWAYQKKDKYSWWIQRIERNYEMFDVIRIDHFHGFDEYYAIPYGDETAEKGTSHKGPGMHFFKTLKKELSDVRIIAEDLGTITESNEKLMKDAGFPGMKVLQYAFDWSESSYYLTYNHDKNCVVYTGTHDNTTTRDWIENLNEHDRDFARQFIHSENSDYGGFVWDFIREAYRSSAELCIVPLQDYLVKGREARINEPGTQGGNWQWRLLPNFLSVELAHSIRQLARIYGRLPKEAEEEL
ncbi:MAG: 4-alpha-glucanotransferase [Eubacterium sp.]|nr:4-alpha-glucanotransferase [Eubacterium sp.]